MDHLPEASTASRELIHYGYKKTCTGHCKCKKAALKCTALCSVVVNIVKFLYSENNQLCNKGSCHIVI